MLVKNKQLCASGTGQTSRVDALRQAIEKANGFGFNLGYRAVMASDAFFHFLTALLPIMLESEVLFNQAGSSKIN